MRYSPSATGICGKKLYLLSAENNFRRKRQPTAAGAPLFTPEKTQTRPMHDATVCNRPLRSSMGVVGIVESWLCP